MDKARMNQNLAEMFRQAYHDIKELSTQVQGSIKDTGLKSDFHLWLPIMLNSLDLSELQMLKSATDNDYACTIAVGTALILSLRYQKTLRVSPGGYHRYWRKSIYESLGCRCFAPNDDLKAAYGAGKAAFFCCAYDVVTDWCDFNEDALNWFQCILKNELSPDIIEIGLDLYRQERDGLLRFDGLSRGIEGMEVIVKIIGSYEYIRRNYDFEYFSLIIQIFDDVLDLEADRQNGDTNCLFGSQRDQYLRAFLDFDMLRFQSVFPRATPLSKQLQNAKKKAAHLLSNSA